MIPYFPLQNQYLEKILERKLRTKMLSSNWIARFFDHQFMPSIQKNWQADSKCVRDGRTDGQTRIHMTLPKGKGPKRVCLFREILFNQLMTFRSSCYIHTDRKTGRFKQVHINIHTNAIYIYVNGYICIQLYIENIHT